MINFGEPGTWKAACVLAINYGIEDANCGRKRKEFEDLESWIVREMNLPSWVWAIGQRGDIYRIYMSAYSGARSGLFKERTKQ